MSQPVITPADLRETDDPNFVRRYSVETERLTMEVTHRRRAKPRGYAHPRDRMGYHAEPRLYIHHSQETTGLEQFFNRHSRPYRQYRKFIVPVVWQMLGTRGTDRWSSKAGCSCPCSPGFVMSGTPAVLFGEERVHTYDIFVTVTGMTEFTEDVSPAALAMAS